MWRAIMKKRKIKMIFGGICFIFIALCVLCFYVTKKVQTPQVLNEIYSLEQSEGNEQTLQVSNEMYSLERSEGLYFHVNINYPQLENTKNVDTEKANELLKDAAFSIRGKTADVAIALLEEVENLDRFEAFDVDYEILRLDESYISIVYMITFYTRGPSYTHHYMTTVDISTGKYIELDDIISIDQLTGTLQAGKFEIYIGTYRKLPDEDAHEPEAINSFIEALKENLALETTESGFDRFSSQNIGLDEKNIYVYFPYDISLNRYFILCVPWESDVIMSEQASVEELDEAGESNEAEESDEVKESDKAEESNETKESDEAEGAARVFNHWLDFLEERDLPYVDNETFEIIKKAYEQVDFFGEFESGNEEVYDAYKEKYKELLENDGLVFDEEAGINVPFSQLDDIGNYIERYKVVYYFFDIDGDDLPELSVHIYGKGIYVLDYDIEKDVCSVWYPMGSWTYSLIGTKKVQWHGNERYLAFYLLDESGKEEYYTFFFYRRHSEESYLAIVMLPEYAEKEKNTKLTETMKSQGIYTRFGGEWYFRINEEQYHELAKPYWEAYDMAKEKKKEVTYTYEELFGGM